MWQPGETIGFRASDHVEAIHRHAGMRLIDVAVVNTRAITRPPAAKIRRRKRALRAQRCRPSGRDGLASGGRRSARVRRQRAPRSARLRRGCTTIGKARTNGTRQDPCSRSALARRSGALTARMKSQINVVILAAGLGTRMKSKRAKVLHRAGGLSLIEHVVQASSAIATGRSHHHRGRSSEQTKFGHLLAPSGVRFVDQKEQKGTGHALLACRESLAAPKPVSWSCSMAIARCLLRRLSVNWSAARLPAKLPLR